MGNADNFNMPHQGVAYAMSTAEWIRAAWNCACEGVVEGDSQVKSCNDGVWTVVCGTLETAAPLLNNPVVMARIHRLSGLRPLPMVFSIRTVLSGSSALPHVMLSNATVAQLSSKCWHELVWRLSVDEETAETTTLVGIRNGVWRVRCDSEHAWRTLQHQEHVHEIMTWLSQIRPVCELKRIDLLLGNMKST